MISVVPPIPPIPPITPEYGAIAIADNGTVGKAWNHRTRAQAEIDALTMCGHPSCQVISSFTQCGAVAYDGSTFHGGVGGTRHTAKNDAMARLGGGRIITSACN
ncbi:DUF4189 domain-containing protein [Mycobacterium decipiens]|uniref:DUF4189 domain-containing protein n=1 Tax=Mycobacterium decipiens TaxID=1430326 RepID=UPI001F61747F|nr:DUF4189 domain-containing protein [Mycobacterium decipiens]